MTGHTPWAEVKQKADESLRQQIAEKIFDHFPQRYEGRYGALDSSITRTSWFGISASQRERFLLCADEVIEMLGRDEQIGDGKRFVKVDALATKAIINEKIAQEKKLPVVKVGQIWEDCDKRSNGRRVEVVSVPDLTDMQNPAEAKVEVRSGKRTVFIKLRRFKPGSTGYRLIKIVQEG